MKSSAIFLIFCIAATAFAQINLQMIEKSNFGSTLLEAVQIHLESQEPIETLQNMLNGMAKQLQQDQEKSDAVHKQFQDKCKEDIDFYIGDIEAAKKTIQETEDDLESLRPRLVKGKKNLGSEESKLDNLQSQLASLIQTRSDEAEEYKKKVAEHERALVAVSEAKKLFSTLLSKNSAFLQTKQGIFTQITSNLRTQVEEMSTPGYKAIFRLLAQVAEKAPVQAEQSTVQKILDLCQKIIDNINDSAQMEKTAENARITAFNKAKGKLESEISETQGNIARLKNLIQSLQQTIKAQEAILADTKDRLAKRQQQLADRTTECNNELSAYLLERKKRTEERDTVDEVITIVNTKLATLKAYLKERVQNAL